MALNVDRRAVGRGAALAVILALPPILVIQVADALVDDLAPAWGGVQFLLIAAAFVLGGRDAAIRGGGAPLTHSAAAGWLAYGILAALSLIGMAVRGEFDAVALISRGLVLSSIAMLGGYLVHRRGVGGPE